jgi:TolB-like protein
LAREEYSLQVGSGLSWSFGTCHRKENDLIAESSLSGPNEKPESTAVPDEKQGKKRKVRSVWIAFVGRVVAQFVGSAATIGLGLMLLYKYEPGSQASVPSARTSTFADSAALPVRSKPVHDSLSLAVLPLLNFSFGDRQQGDRQQYVADSMTDLLTADLAQIRWLHVVSRTSAASVAAQRRAATEIAASLGVHYILEGSVAQSNGRMRITALLIDAFRDEPVWARRYERAAQDVFATQEEVATAIVRDLTAELAQDEGDASIPTTGR